MSRIDRIKEELGWLKIVFGIFVAIDVSLMAWLAQNYDNIARVLIVCGFLGIVFVTMVIAWVNHAAIKRFKELEKE